MGVLASSGLQPGNADQLLFALRGANFQQSGDQQFSRVFSGSAYLPLFVVARQRSGSASVLTAGGVYDQPARAGNALVVAGQVWSNLGPSGIVSVQTTNLLQTGLFSQTPYFNLSTVSTSACTGDILIFGLDVS